MIVKSVSCCDLNLMDLVLCSNPGVGTKSEMEVLQVTGQEDCGHPGGHEGQEVGPPSHAAGLLPLKCREKPQDKYRFCARGMGGAD